MTIPTDRSQPFDEALLSGYLDGELTQAEEQRVRIYLENNPDARRLLNDIRAMREAAMTTSFNVPDDRQWDERPRSRLSALFRRTGWLLVVVWTAGITAYALWEFFTSGLTREKLFAVAGLSGVALVFLSVLFDRLRDLKTDRYRRVRQ